VSYKIVGSPAYNRLAEMVNKEIDVGWNPLGGVVVSSGPWFYQALVRPVVVLKSWTSYLTGSMADMQAAIERHVMDGWIREGDIQYSNGLYCQVFSRVANHA
jgi:hypothetical protein